MKATIICEVPEKGIHQFSLIAEGRKYYLFRQNYRKGVQAYYHGGVSLPDAICFARSHRDDALMRTMEKIPNYVKYIEKEYGIEVMDRTRARNSRKDRRKEVNEWPGMAELIDEIQAEEMGKIA